MGYIKLYRKLFDWEWYGQPNMVALWIHILLSANHENKEWRGVQIRRGEFYTSLSSLATETGLSVQTIRTCLKKLVGSKQINIKSTRESTKIIVCNYEDYQSNVDCCQQTTNTPTNSETTHGLTTTKEYKNIRKQEDKKKDAYASKEKVEIVDRLYALYPSSVVRNGGNRVSLKSAKDKDKLLRMLSSHSEQELETTIRKYLDENHGAYLKMFGTFLNNLPDYSEPVAEPTISFDQPKSTHQG